MEEISLSEFQDGEETDEQAPAPVEPTAQFVAGGGECEACERTVERLWVADGRRVCLSCKPW